MSKKEIEKITRDKMLRFRVTESERDRIELEASKRGLKMSELLRIVLIEKGILGETENDK